MHTPLDLLTMCAPAAALAAAPLLPTCDTGSVKAVPRCSRDIPLRITVDGKPTRSDPIAINAGAYVPTVATTLPDLAIAGTPPTRAPSPCT